MKIDLHVHSTYSIVYPNRPVMKFDSIIDPRQIIKAAIKKGVQGVSITDHNTLKGTLIAKKIAKRIDKKFIVISGEEIRSIKGDILAYGIKDDVPYNLNIEETIEKIHDQNGLAIAAHPFENIRRKSMTEEGIIGNKFDGIEVFNAHRIGEHNQKSLEFLKEKNLCMTAGSDAHTIGTVGIAGIQVEGNSEDEILEKIRKKKVKIFGKEVSKFLYFREFLDRVEYNLVS